MREYKVSFYMDNTYQVIHVESDEVMFQGNISDCEAWIRLKEEEYL